MLPGASLKQITHIIIVANDDNGQTVNSRLRFAVPADGVYIMGATAFPDSSFSGGGTGTYELSISDIAAAVTISGRVVESGTGAPLSGGEFPFPFVYLYRCDGGICGEPIGFTSVDTEGRFNFLAESSGGLLFAGTYAVVARGATYYPTRTEPFSVAAAEDRDIGDIAIAPVPRIGSISGRVIDASTKKGLPGDADPFVSVFLSYCDSITGSCTSIQQATDGAGRFSFEHDPVGNPLTIGSYSLDVFADQYFSFFIPPFDVGEGEHYDVGDIQLISYPVRFTELKPCTGIPANGGTCRYSVRVTNGTATTLHGASWSIVDAFSPGSNTGSTFQTGTPRQLQLHSGKSTVVEFSFRVPPRVPDGASMCMRAFASKDQQTLLFNTVGQQFLFCISKGGSGGFKVMPEKQARELMRRMHSTGAP